MVKIKLVGTFLIIIALLGIIYFTLSIPVDLYFYELSPEFPASPGFIVPFIPWDVFDWRWAIAIPVYAAIVVFCCILIWMGRKMVTTPTTKPIQQAETRVVSQI